MKKADCRYIHEETVHNLVSPKEIVPIIVEMFHPKSVIDFGCGIGTFIHEFSNAGVPKLTGVDGEWVNKELLSKYMKKEQFITHNLETPFISNYRYDVAICLEVAEHIDEKYADIFVNSLVGMSDIIIFSAAIPLQGGQGHINEQWPEYWQEKFAKHGYDMLDIIRPILWNNPKVFHWYKQNMFVVAKQKYADEIKQKYVSFSHDIAVSLVHPDLYLRDAKRLKEALSGEWQWKAASSGQMSIRLYLRMLKKAIIRKTKKFIGASSKV